MRCRHGYWTTIATAGFLCIPACAYARQQSTAPPRTQTTNATSATQPDRGSAGATLQASPGLEAPWDVRKTLTEVGNNTQQFQPLLAQMNPQQWYEQKGAPSTYILQWQTAQRQLNDVSYTIRQLSQKTDSLSLALDTYFRLETLDVTARSLEEGAQRYANRATAEKLNTLIAHNFNNRERLRDYIRDLAASTEQNFKIADDEAQRCRAMITNVPAATSRRSKKY